MMSYSEISSTYAPDFVRVELRSHIRYDGDKGTVGSAAFTWTAKDPHAVMMTLRWKERTNIWTLDVELLRRIVSSDRESVGDGQITGHTSGDVTRITNTWHDGWMSVNIHKLPMGSFLTSIDDRMSAVKSMTEEEFDAALHTWLGTGGASGSW
jgi:hypothetical protein